MVWTIIIDLNEAKTMVLLLFMIVFELYNDKYNASDSRYNNGRPPLHTYRDRNYGG